MVVPQIIEHAINRVTDQQSFVRGLLADTLEWPIPDHLDNVQELGLGWTADELRAQGLERHLLDGQVWQIKLREGQPWGIFVVEFAQQQVYRTVLRQVLRGLVPSRRHDPNLPDWHHENLLFICVTRDYERFTFAHFRGEQAQTARLATFGWQKRDRHLRTVCEFNLPPLIWPDDEGRDHAAWLKKWAGAFDKEPLTKDFFRRFDKAVDAVKADLETIQGFSPSEAYSRAQLLLERLLFLYFLQNRGWLDQQRDYLLSHFAPHQGLPEDFSYYCNFLEKLFWTLASAPGPVNRLPGIPFLNGGLFDDDEFAPTPNRHAHNPPLQIRNATFAQVFADLLEAFNFTVREDTPLDQDVAVDPEMLGKVFESIVLHAEAADPDAIAPDKRKATGSYYTPRIVVHFICREVLLQYLRRHQCGPDWDTRLKGIFALDAGNGLNADAVAALRKLLTPQEGAALRDRLRDLKCCDPAVGSGAFPVGLLHELLVLRRIAETAANGYVDPVRKHGASWLHDVKEEIVENCLFGVDIQQQAIEICRLRLWLTLVVDYDIGLDPFTAERQQFLQAIGRISQLPNLEMNFHRGDSLLDMISDVPVRIEPGALSFHKKQINALQELNRQLHRAKKADRKKDLRIELLRGRLDLTEDILQEQLVKFQNQDSEANAWLFAEIVPNREKSRRLADAMDKCRNAIAKIQTDRKELNKLAARRLDKDFYPKLRRLEGADFNSPFNFAWQLDFAGILTPERGGFDIVVGNPPFVTARNPTKRELYRERWTRSCEGQYLLLCPFFELSFALLRENGQLGFIVSNAFAKREFGRPLINRCFSTVTLQKAVDCSGLQFPGHGTPTCIIFASAQPPHPSVPVQVVALLPGGGDLRTPPEESKLWQAIARNHDQVGYEDNMIAVYAWPRPRFLQWPLNFDLGADNLRLYIEGVPGKPLQDFLVGSVGRVCFTGADELYFVDEHLLRRIGFSKAGIARFAQGDRFRNWSHSETHCLCPYDEQGDLLKGKESAPIKAYLKPWEAFLRNRLSYGETQDERNLAWWEYSLIFPERIRGGIALSICEIATHVHVEMIRKPFIANRANPIFELAADFREWPYHLVSGLLNSSVAGFWLKQVCYNKGAGEDEERDRFEYAGGKLEQLPVLETLAPTLRAKEEFVLTHRLADLSEACWTQGQSFPGLALQKLFYRAGEAYWQWYTALPGYALPQTGLPKAFTNAIELRAALEWAINRRNSLRSTMIALQEEMDWLVYAAYKLIPDLGPALKKGDLTLAREQRPFCLWAQAEGNFERAVQLIPREWSAPRRALWEERLRLIRDNEHVRRIEQPVYKRRWDEQWKIGNSWQCGQPAYDAEFLDAFEWWLSEKAEFWLETQQDGGLVALPVWTAALWSDPRVSAAWEVAAEAAHRLEHWKAQQSETTLREAPILNASPAAFAKFFKALVKEQSVPESIPFARPWEELEKTMRVPAQVKKVRGRLNVPRERFWTTAVGEYRVARFA